MSGLIDSDIQRGFSIKRRRTLQVLGAITILALGTFLVMLALAPPDPVYKGKRLSEHLMDASRRPSAIALPLEGRFVAELPAAREPLEALGPAAIPLLDAWLNQPNSKFRSRVGEFATARNLRWERFYIDRQTLAFSALYVAGPNASPVAPKLLNLVQNGTPYQQIRAAGVLSRILETTAQTNRLWIAQQSRTFYDAALAENPRNYDTAKLWLLTQLAQQYGEGECERLLRKLDLPARYWSQRYLDRDGSIQNLLHLESTNDAAKVGAAMLFRDSPVWGDRVVPLLIQTLTSSNRSLLARSAEALGSYGAQSRAALPLLSNLLTHPRPAVSNAARSAIQKIGNAQQ